MPWSIKNQPALTRRSAMRLGLGALTALPGSGLLTSAARAAAETAPAISLRRGVNAWPWFSLTSEYPAPRHDYPYPPYQPGRPLPGSSDLHALRMMGLDFVRLPFDPGPFLAAKPAQRASLLADLRAAIAQCLSHDLKVLLDIHPNTGTHYWTPANMVASRQAPEYPAYRALVGQCAALLAEFAPDRVALEAVNEPPQACTDSHWPQVQIDLLTTARAAAPRLTLVAGGACGSGIDGLEQLDPAPLRPFAPLLYTFHFYEPFVFSHQGATWTGDDIQPYLSAVRWPASAGTFAQSWAATRAKLAAMAPGSSPDHAHRLEEALRIYYAARPDLAYIRRFFTRVQNWASSHAIAPDLILLGEFGALKTDGRTDPAAISARSHYLADIRQSAEAAGFGWCLWSLFDSFGLLDDVTHQPDAAMQHALGLR